ncbi:hypothetical protein GCM10027162_41560 [Streptomyces incanus]
MRKGEDQDGSPRELKEAPGHLECTRVVQFGDRYGTQRSLRCVREEARLAGSATLPRPRVSRVPVSRYVSRYVS